MPEKRWQERGSVGDNDAPRLRQCSGRKEKPGQFQENTEEQGRSLVVGLD